jgi:glycine oxidase
MTPDRNGGADLVVVGGGVIGLAVARDAAARGMSVVVLERGRCGREASWAAAGMLSPLGEAVEPGPFLRLALQSVRAWPGFAAELEEGTGIPLEYREGGKLRLALTDEEERRLRGRHEWARREGFAAEWLDPQRVRELEPEIAPETRGALRLDEDYRVDARALATALASDARARGVQVREGTSARSIEVRGGGAREGREGARRVTGVRLDGGERMHAPAVLLAAGAWCGEIGGLPRALPVRPVRGQMLALRPAAPPRRRVIESERVYLVPRDDGRLLVGATVEEVGFRGGTTAEGVRGLLTAAIDLVPGLADAPLVDLWSGFRPGTPDGMPILGEHPGLEGLYLATGHFRNGILLTPATGRLLGALVAGEAQETPPREFLPDRFLPEAQPAEDPLRQESTR